MPRSRSYRPGRWWFLLPLAVGLLTAAVFAPAIQNGFTNWDDPAYVLQDHLLRDLSPSGLQAIGTTFVEGNYHPLTILSLAVDYHLWKLNPLGYHLTNVVIHVLATLAVFWLVLLLTESRELSTITALFFGIHPLHVESVAWISARKDVLYVLFYFIACASYVLYVRKGQRIFWVCALAASIFSLLSKGMAVTLPLAFIAIDLYLKRPWNARALLEKIPFFGISLLFGVITIVAQQNSVQAFSGYPLQVRVLVGFHGLATYIIRAVVPTGLSALYPYPVGRTLPVEYYLAPSVALLVGLMIAKSLKSDRTYALAGIFFLINVALVLQFLPVGSAAMADRYTYVAYFGIGLALARGFQFLRNSPFGRRATPRALLTAILIVLFGAWILVTRERIHVWKNNITLWTSVLAEYPAIPLAYAQRAWSYEQQGNSVLAMADLEKALALDPNDADARSTRGSLYYSKGDYPRALADLNVAVRSQPRFASAVNSRGAVLLAMNRYDEAIADFTRAIELRPSLAEAYLNRALAYGMKKEYRRTLPELDRAILYDPGNPRAYLLRGVSKLALGDTARAIQDYGEALRVAPAFGDAYFARSLAYEALGRRDEALRDALRAQEAGYHVADSYISRLRALGSAGGKKR
jgi:tetratricopeptide (TPR) repeat protein